MPTTAPPSTPSTPTAPSGPKRYLAKDNQSLLDAIFASATDYAIITMDTEMTIASWNAGAEFVFGYAADEVLGQPAALIFTPEDRADGVPQLEARTARETGRSTDYRWHLRRDQSRFWADGALTPIRDEHGALTGYLKILHDISDKKRAELELLRLAKLDTLTGLPNRSAFNARLRELASAALRNGQSLILMLLDLDKFKQVNDRWGHVVGDGLLQQAAERMRHAKRDTDFLARIGGDEFVVLQPHVHAPHDGAPLADKLVAALAAPFQIDGTEVLSGASVGITVFPLDGSSADQLLKNADLAMYEVKKQGGNGYHYFTEQLDRDAHQRSGDLLALRRAIGAGAFRLDYQPQVASVSGRTVAAEALLRCTEPRLAGYPIERVIDLANDSGQMAEIGVWVMREACAQLGRWRAAGLAPVRIGVNLCPAELASKDLTGCVGALLAEHALSGRDLEVEVTERQLLDCGSPGIETLAALRAGGVSVAIDDFGTGYSSLGYLGTLPVDTVKLDRSFLRGIPHHADSCVIASAIVQLARTLKLGVVIEGVESAEQARFFRSDDSELLQGFYFSRPLDGDAMTAWLARQA